MIWNPFRKLQKVEEKRSIPTVKFDPKRVTPAIQKDIQEFVLSFEEIRQDKRQSVVEASLEDLVGGGGNSHVVFTALQAAGVDRKVALRITDLVTKRSRWRLNTQRQIQTGLTEAEWMWSGAPCISSNPPSKAEKRMAEQHKSANGKRYDIREGLMIDGERQFPGLEYGCRCTSRMILPGWND